MHDHFKIKPKILVNEQIHTRKDTVIPQQDFL